ncbi:zinc knuckle transcription factor [Grosmannia clavigera kw1407]|uniref:Zinc knuckle transcription factor n=1 Tax=Grosmannia clavigera (strain kw1407 / UAMH 11150) TaxID=655863 RepID=F0XRV2_GROCL|nr:zinc knuckle transcription factor [Grosmannia clavigera kw1407]EFW99399.1 zinc knuckle transcription factor [Grosmannia clavigera kw1407]
MANKAFFDNQYEVDRDAIPDHSPEEALEYLIQAIGEKDLGDVKIAVQMYVKALPKTTYVGLEKLLRAKNIPLFLIGVEKIDMASTFTNMDFQGNLDKQFSVTYRFQSRPSRPREKNIWPTSAEENLARLANGGEPVPRGIPLCSNCKELGHISRNCPIEKQEILDKATVTCYNCGETGHRVRDCPEPRSAENVEYRKCGEKPRNVSKMQCHNCDEYGHISKDCQVPRNMDRTRNFNGQQTDHFRPACKNEASMEAGGDAMMASNSFSGHNFGCERDNAPDVTDATNVVAGDGVW